LKFLNCFFSTFFSFLFELTNDGFKSTVAAAPSTVESLKSQCGEMRYYYSTVLVLLVPSLVLLAKVVCTSTSIRTGTGTNTTSTSIVQVLVAVPISELKPENTYIRFFVTLIIQLMCSNG
jgi:hypothetical protein